MSCVELAQLCPSLKFVVVFLNAKLGESRRSRADRYAIRSHDHELTKKKKYRKEQNKVGCKISVKTEIIFLFLAFSQQATNVNFATLSKEQWKLSML